MMWPTIHPDDLQRLASSCSYALDHSGAEVLVTFRVRHLDGSWRTLEARGSVLIGESGVEGAVISRDDVTEHQRAEDAIRERAIGKALQNSRLVGIGAFDPEGRQIYANPRLCEMVGWSEEQLVGATPPFVYWPPEETDAIAAFFEGMQTQHAYNSTEVRFRRRNEERFPGFVSVAPLTDNGGERRGWLAFVYDLTERRNLEENLRQAQKMEAVGRLTGGIAHDFNSLITAIHGYVGLALEQVPEGGQLRGDLLEIRNTTDRAASLIRQLLAFSRRRPLQPSPLDLNAEVARVEKMLCRLISEDIDVRVQLDPGPCWIKADPGQIEQLLVNLAVNARDAMSHGGTLTIQTAVVDLTETRARRLGLVGTRPGPYVRLRVSDTGTGLTSDARAHLFEPFFTTKEAGQGTGLGLAIVSEIVKQGGGCISVDSEFGHGTTFTIHQPRVQEAFDLAEPVAAQAAPQPGSETILLVEDEDRLRALVGRVLELSGYTVLEARNSGEAVLTADGYSGRPIHLLLTDVVMPGMDGCALAELVTQSRRDLKVLYMSGHTDHAALLQSALDDSVAFLAKPFTPSVLLRKVRQVLDRAD